MCNYLLHPCYAFYLLLYIYKFITDTLLYYVFSPYRSWGFLHTLNTKIRSTSPFWND